MKDLLNVVVGSGSAGQLANCISSVLSLCPSDLVVYYNYQDEQDRRSAQSVLVKSSLQSNQFVLQSNDSQLRTGSLYSAYNQALARAEGRYRYVSFIQADMQMMWWSHRIIEACDEIRSSSNKVAPSSMCFFSQLPVRGKRPDYYSIWRDQSEMSCPSLPGIADVAIFPADVARSEQPFFQGSESEMMEWGRANNFRVGLHPMPFLAPIPFPRTARDMRRTSRQLDRIDKTQPLLVLNAPGMALVQNFAGQSLHPLYMEDLVVPNGWRCLTPYWPSDTNNAEWVRQRIAVVRQSGTSFFSVAGKTGAGKLLERFPRPGVTAILSALVKITSQELISRFLRLRRDRDNQAIELAARHNQNHHESKSPNKTQNCL